jgi:hypothetical protein
MEEDMDYGKLFTKAWDIIWKNKFLILLGVLIVLGGSGSGNGSQGQYLFTDDNFRWEDIPQFEFNQPFQDWQPPLFAIGGVAIIVVVLVLIGLAFWVVGQIARGGLIFGVNEIEKGNQANFSNAFQAGWNKGWRLIGIGLIPAIPGLFLLVAGGATFFAFGGFAALTQGNYNLIAPGVFVPLFVLACVLIPISIILTLLRTFANRACMLEDQGVFNAYKRGFEVLGDNLGPAVLLYIIQIAVSLVFGMMMILPGILIALCCFLWPLFILIEAAFITYYSTLWTLAWNEWVGTVEIVPTDQ